MLQLQYVHFIAYIFFDTQNVPHIRQHVSYNQLHIKTRSTIEWEELQNMYDDEWSSNQPSSGRKLLISRILSSITERKQNNYLQDP